MARFRNAAGVTVNVDDETAARLGAGWEPVKDSATTEEKPKATRRASAKSKSDEK